MSILNQIILTISLVMFLAAAFGRRPINSIIHGVVGGFLLFIYFLLSYELGLGLVLGMSIFLVLSMSIMHCVSYFDVEKEYQRIYGKSLTSILGVLVFTFIFGALVVFVYMNGLDSQAYKMINYSFGMYGAVLSMVVLFMIVMSCVGYFVLGVEQDD